VGERVVIADPLSAAGIQMLRSVPSLDVVETAGKGPEALHDALVDAVALIVRSETKVTADLMAKGQKLRVIARAGIGTDNIDLEEATRRGIPVLTAPGANSTSAAEHTFALLLALLRKVPAAAALLAAGKWDRKPFQGTELRGKTLGVLGLGRIGSEVARRARGFNMRVLAYDPFISAEAAQALGVELVDLPELYPQADFITIHTPLNDETRHLVNRRTLSLMKPTAYLVNTSRGPMVDHEALAEALRGKKIAGAGIDVYDTEPPESTYPLLGLENAILTPHLSWYS